MPTSNYTTVGWHVYTVPNRVTSLTISMDGAGSGSRGGGRITGKLAVRAGQKLYCHVGLAGKANAGASGGGATNGAGAAGGAGRSRNGGWSGGGYSIIRLGSTTGSIKAVAGGAGGDSGDGGAGGPGGGTTGGSGRKAGTIDLTGIATGGTQVQGGNGGTSPAGAAWNGANASDTQVAIAGQGGTPPSGTGYGGGGGGGGFHPGGGGQASADGVTGGQGGGGGGGSSYHGGLTGAADVQGGGGAGNGNVTISWVTPPPGNIPPVTPTDVKVNNVEADGGMLTKATTSVKISANIFDPDKHNVRLLVRWSTQSNFSSYKQGFTGWTTWAAEGRVVAFTMTGLVQNTHYYVRLYAQDAKGMYSTTYNSIDFWTNKAPLPPTDLRINTQSEGMMLPVASSGTFGWTHNDEDVADYQSGFQIQYRIAATSSNPAGTWTVVTQYPGVALANLPPKVPGPPSSSHNEWVFNPGTFLGNSFYEWQVRTRDGQALWGEWSTLFSFFSQSTNTPPLLVSPGNGLAVVTDNDQAFTWKFIDPDPGNVQVKADIRWRALGLTKQVTSGTAPPAPDEWIMLLGAVAPGVPGATASWTIQDHTFVGGYTYEWQVRTYDSVSVASGWSAPYRFHAIDLPGSEGGSLPISGAARPQGSLGCGEYRVFVYEQGGQKLLGEVTPMTKLNFNRVRDDISGCTVFSNGYSYDCGAFYGTIRSWMHELVVFRDGVRVWEGPITRIAYKTDEVEIEAKDVMAYVYRRIMRIGYNDAYRLVKAGTAGQPDEYLGLLSVVRRATMLVTQALAPFDPNVLPYLTALEHATDAKESRIVADWSRTCWEEVDDLAATAGLDYTTVGRRILLWDTHRPIGRLPELRDGDFSDSPIVTEYGMQLATFFAVTNGSGVVGWHSQSMGNVPYGPIEQLASSYSDSEGAAGEILTPAAKAAAEKALIEQAQRNISGRWPAPLIVRIPDNTTLSPKANIGFQQLIPGVWLPLRSVATPRPVAQWQKLDSVAVEVAEAGEQVHVVFSPAPNGGNDPDSDMAMEDG